MGEGMLCCWNAENASDVAHRCTAQLSTFLALYSIVQVSKQCFHSELHTIDLALSHATRSLVPTSPPPTNYMWRKTRTLLLRPQLNTKPPSDMGQIPGWFREDSDFI